jgi:hypothetical protein
VFFVLFVLCTQCYQFFWIVDLYCPFCLCDKVCPSPTHAPPNPKSWVRPLLGIGFMVFNTTFNTISVISWRSVLLVEETGVPALRFPHKTMFGSSLPLVVCRGPRSYLRYFLRIVVCFLFCLSCVPNVTSLTEHRFMWEPQRTSQHETNNVKTPPCCSYSFSNTDFIIFNLNTSPERDSNSQHYW